MTRHITVRSGAVPRKVVPPASAASISIEPTFLVAASDARPAIKAVADFVCDGTADEVQINAALTAVAALAQGGIVQLSSGLFSCADQITHTTGSKQIWLRGAGRNATLIETSGNAPATRNGIIYLIAPYATISDLGADVNHNGYRNVIYLDVTMTTVGALQRVTVGMFSSTVTDIDAAISIGHDIEVYDVEVTESSKGDGIWAFGTSGGINIGGVQIHSATTDGNGNGWGIRLGSSLTSCRVHDSFLENCAVAGIWVASDNSIIIGNDAADGIVVFTTANGTVLGGNIGTITDNGTNTRIFDDDTDAIHDNVDGEIVLVTEKASPDGADVLLIEDSAAGNAKKRVQITNLPGGADADAIHDNVASEISVITAKATPDSGDFLVIEDSAAANVKKSMTVAALEAVLSHDNIADVTTDDHHAQAHNIASHSDTTATGTELETLTDGSNADSLHAHTASSPALDDITDVTITAVATNEVLAKSAGDWINRTLTEAGIAAESHGSHDHDTPIATHAAIVDSHHAKYTDGEVDAIVATHAAITTAHHTKYTDAEAASKIAADDLYVQTAGDTMGGALNMGNQTLLAPLDPTLGTHVGDRDFNDGRYDAAGTAASQDHDHATPIATHAALPNVHHNEAHTIVSHSDTTATGAELETLTDGSETTLHSHAGAAGAAFSELMLIGA